jgi:hypothetical protein
MPPVDLAKLSRDSLRGLDDTQFKATLAAVLAEQRRHRQENQLLYYEPNSERALAMHCSKAKVIGIGGGNRSGKTTGAIVEALALATGIFPESIEAECREKFQGPIRIRMCVESLTATLHGAILPKFQWWQWSGVSEPGGNQGHWGWVPRGCLINGQWDKSWSEKLRTLTFDCHDPDNPGHVLGQSSAGFMSYDQDPSHFASGSYDIVIHDEPPSYAIWRENMARVMDVDGRMFLVMTWPDDPAIPVDWIYDEVYEKGRPGPNKLPSFDWFELHTLDNPHLNREATIAKLATFDDATREVRSKGVPIRFSNRIHPLFTDTSQDWCFNCKKAVYTTPEGCAQCGSTEVVTFNHVCEFDIEPWPAVWLIDPHPRKPHMWLWGLVDPSDDIWVAAEGALDGDPSEVRDAAFETEARYGLQTTVRLIDPNMARSPASSQRGVTWQDEFEHVGLRCDLADDGDPGRSRINEFLKPDYRLYRPRLHVHPRCQTTIAQMKRYTWDEHRASLEKDLKQKPRAKNDDYPTLLKYLMNYEPSFTFLHGGAPVIRRAGTRKGAY